MILGIHKLLREFGHVIACQLTYVLLLASVLGVCKRAAIYSNCSSPEPESVSKVNTIRPVHFQARTVFIKNRQSMFGSIRFDGFDRKSVSSYLKVSGIKYMDWSHTVNMCLVSACICTAADDNRKGCPRQSNSPRLFYCDRNID